MRKSLLCFGVVLVALVGCQSGHKSAECGWRFEVIKPPIVHTEMPLLVQSGPGLLNAVPAGSVAGPVIGPIQMSGALPSAVGPRPASCQSGPEDDRPSLPRSSARPAAVERLSCEEWCELLRRVQQDRTLPRPREEKPMPKEE